MNFVQIVIVLLSVLLRGAQSTEGKFWHVTDFHYDFSYEDYNTGQFSCNSKVPLSKLGVYGDYLCDSPWKLILDSVNTMRTLEPNPDFIIWTGDNVMHIMQGTEDQVLSFDINMGMIQNVTNLLKAVFPGVPIYPCLGNHDNFPDAQIPAGNSPIYNRLANMWASVVNDSQAMIDFRKGGYYTKLLSQKLRLISLNTILYYKFNKVASKLPDPANQYVWLEDKLKNARKSQEKVIIIAHVAPGKKIPDGLMWFTEKHNTRFNKLILSFSDVIVATHFGHDHEESFKIYYDDKGVPKIPIFIAPSVTPWTFITKTFRSPNRNPGVRLVNYDRQDGKHLDITQYYLPLTKANSKMPGLWLKAYSVRQEYSVPDVTAASMDKIWSRYLDPNSATSTTLKKVYFHHTLDTNDDMSQPCDDKCQSGFICATRHLDNHGFKKCFDAMLLVTPSHASSWSRASSCVHATALLMISSAIFL